MDSDKSDNKIKPMKKRNVHEGRSRTSLCFTAPVHEHFKEVLTQLYGFVAFVQWSQLKFKDANDI